MKKYIVELTEEERSMLRGMIKKGKGHSAQKLSRARILLKADQSQGNKWLADEEIAEVLDVSLPTVERLRKNFVEKGIEKCLERKAREGVPYNLKRDGRLEACTLAIACSEAPEGRARWTLRLIGDRLVELGYKDGVSYETVRQILKKTRFSLIGSKRGA